MRDRITIGLIAGLLALAGLEAVLVGEDAGHGVWWQAIAGGMALLGLVSCVVVVLASKALGKHLLQRREERDEP